MPDFGPKTDRNRLGLNNPLTIPAGAACPHDADCGPLSGCFHEVITMSGPDGVAGARLRAFVERIEHIDEEIKGRNEGKKEIFDEAKGEGYDVKILKE
jgi:hypothetical protein